MSKLLNVSNVLDKIFENSDDEESINSESSDEENIEDEDESTGEERSSSDEESADEITNMANSSKSKSSRGTVRRSRGGTRSRGMTRGRIKQVNKCTTPTQVIEEDERTYYSLKGYNIFFTKLLSEY